MKNLYKGKSVASIEMITLEAVGEMIAQNRSKIRRKILYSNVGEQQELLLREKMEELRLLKDGLFGAPYSEVLKIQQNINQDIDDFIARVL